MGRKKKGQLPSGSVRIQKKVGIREDGSRIMKSFTGVDRDDAERKYKLWLLGQKAEPKQGTITIQEAVTRYIAVKRYVLSPTTVSSYEGIVRTYIDGTELGGTYLEALTPTALQAWVSDLASSVSPKTVRNANALVRSSVEMFLPDFRYRVTLPQRKQAELYCPSDADVRAILEYIRKNDPELEKAVLLAAFGPLRRSEICALTRADIKGNTITVNKALVMDDTKAWVLKTTKTVGSTRTVRLPDFVMERISGTQEAIVSLNPNQITNRFHRGLKRSGIGVSFRFHDLRHYAASIMHAIGVPDQYIMARGGWTSDTVMKRVYRNIIDIEEVKQTDKIIEHFKKVSHV